MQLTCFHHEGKRVRGERDREWSSLLGHFFALTLSFLNKDMSCCSHVCFTYNETSSEHSEMHKGELEYTKITCRMWREASMTSPQRARSLHRLQHNWKCQVYVNSDSCARTIGSSLRKAIFLFYLLYVLSSSRPYGKENSLISKELTEWKKFPLNSVSPWPFHDLDENLQLAFLCALRTSSYRPQLTCQQLFPRLQVIQISLDENETHTIVTLRTEDKAHQVCFLHYIKRKCFSKCVRWHLASHY